MDKNTQQIQRVRAVRAVENLKRNKFDAHFVESVEQMNELISTMIPAQSTVAVGGSMSLFETGVIEWLRQQPVTFYDRYNPENDVQEMFRKAFYADVFVTSTNAVTMEGELLNVDGSGNRTAAMIFGPKKVLVITGINKLVKNMAEAEQMIKRTARPMNNERLNTNNPCRLVGECTECISESRICSVFVRTARSHVRDRICVILVNEDLGY
jgi:L-lactate utilization protein LutB